MRKTTPFRIDKAGTACVKEINSAYVKNGIDIVNMTMGVGKDLSVLPTLSFEQGFSIELDRANADLQAGIMLNTPKKYPVYFRLAGMQLMLEFRGKHQKGQWTDSKVYFYIPTEIDDTNYKIYWGSLISRPEAVTDKEVEKFITLCQTRATIRFIEAKDQS